MRSASKVSLRGCSWLLSDFAIEVDCGVSARVRISALLEAGRDAHTLFKREGRADAFETLLAHSAKVGVLKVWLIALNVF